VQVTLVVPMPVRRFSQPAGAAEFSTPMRLSGWSDVQVKFSPAMLFSASAITNR
jgi:hypothetical protein